MPVSRKLRGPHYRFRLSAILHVPMSIPSSHPPCIAVVALVSFASVGSVGRRGVEGRAGDGGVA